jgi:hypothetical protein
VGQSARRRPGLCRFPLPFHLPPEHTGQKFKANLSHLFLNSTFSPYKILDLYYIYFTGELQLSPPMEIQIERFGNPRRAAAIFPIRPCRPEHQGHDFFK